MKLSGNEKQPIAHSGMQTIPVIRGDEFRVSDGVNLGDPLQEASELLLDDYFQISRAGRIEALDIVPVTEKDTGNGLPAPEYRIATTSTLGTPGNAIYLDSVITLMAQDGKTVDSLIMIEVSSDTGYIASSYLLPIADILPGQPYRLVGINPESARKFFALVSCVSFTRGTQITMADGTQQPIETLRPGEKVLTRDNGPQKVRWVGEITRRAVGEFAPILIRKDTLNNSRDLLVSPGHRLFFWQRVDELNLGRSEVLVQARHLVDGDRICQSEGGFIDYFQILFDDHQIIFAEGIATESMLLSSHTKPALPEALSQKFGENAHSRYASRTGSYEEGIAELALEADIASRLRRASSPR